MLFNSRTPIGLVGRSASISSGAYTDSTATIAAETDSYYEYLLKGYLQVGALAFVLVYALVYVLYVGSGDLR